jgi:phage I-like protein
MDKMKVFSFAEDAPKDDKIHEFKPNKDNEQIIKILHTGNFTHYGDTFELTDETFKSFMKNFRDKVVGTDPPIDFSHDSWGAAAGWIIDLIINDDSLYAKIKWTDAGLEALASKEYRYFSATFTFNYFDGSTGDTYGSTLLGGALTNIPFMRHNPPIVELNKKKFEIHELKIEEKKELSNMDNVITLDKHEAKVTELNEVITGLQADITELSQVKIENKELLDKLKAIEVENKATADNAEFDKKLNDKENFSITCEAQREPYIAGDFKKVMELMQPVNLDATGSNGDSDAVQLTAEEKQIARSLDLTDEEFAKTK